MKQRIRNMQTRDALHSPLAYRTQILRIFTNTDITFFSAQNIFLLLFNKVSNVREIEVRRN